MRVNIVVATFEDFSVGDIIVDNDASGSVLVGEHRQKTVSIAIQLPADHELEER